MAELTQRQQDRIAKSSTDRLQSQLVRSGVEERDVSHMEREELKTVAAQVEAGRLTGEEARRKSLPDDGEEMFVLSEAMGARAQEYEVLKMKLELQRLEMEAESLRIDVEARMADREAEIRKMELKAQLERQRLEAEVRMAELKTGAHGELHEPANENGEGLMLRAPQSVDNLLDGRTKKFGDALRHVK